MNVAVTTRIVDNTPYPEPRDALSHDWCRLLDQLGVCPILIPNQLSDPSRLLAAANVQALLLTNGEDLGQLAAAGQQPAADQPLPRDRTELALLEAAIARELPVLGVCRGLQLLNAYFGGQLQLDLEAEVPDAGDHVAPTGHPARIVDGVFRELLDASELTVNSYHRHGVTLAGLAPPLRPFAVAAGDVVEGLYHPGQSILAIQWHPERPSVCPEVDRRLLHHWLHLVQ